MNIIDSVVWIMLGLVFVVGVPATLYLKLPRSVLDTATSHGRYAGLGVRTPSTHLPGGVRRLDSISGRRP